MLAKVDLMFDQDYQNDPMAFRSQSLPPENHGAALYLEVGTRRSLRELKRSFLGDGNVAKHQVLCIYASTSTV